MEIFFSVGQPSWKEKEKKNNQTFVFFPSDNLTHTFCFESHVQNIQEKVVKKQFLFTKLLNLTPQKKEELNLKSLHKTHTKSQKKLYTKHMTEKKSCTISELRILS